MADRQGKDTWIQNVVFDKSGKLIPMYTIRQITEYRKRTIINESNFKEMFHNKDKEDLSPAEYMIRYRWERNYNFQLLLNDPLFLSESTSETYTIENRNQ